MLLVRVLSTSAWHTIRACKKAAKMLPKNCRVIGVLITLTTLLLAWLLASHCHSRLPIPKLKPPQASGSDRQIR